MSAEKDAETASFHSGADVFLEKSISTSFTMILTWKVSIRTPSCVFAIPSVTFGSRCIRPASSGGFHVLSGFSLLYFLGEVDPRPLLSACGLCPVAGVEGLTLQARQHPPFVGC